MAGMLGRWRRGIADVAQRLRVGPRVLWQTGLLGDARAAGALALLGSRGRPDPSLVFRYHARNSPHRTALIYGDRSLSYFEFDRTVDRLGHALKRAGIGRGDAIAIMLRNVPEVLLLQAAAGRIGAAAACLSWRSTSAELQFLLSDSQARALFFDPAASERVQEALPAVPALADHCFAVGASTAAFPSYAEWLAASTASSASAGPLPLNDSDTGAVIIYTSGTTGKPKGAVRKFGHDVVLAVLSFIGETPMRVGDVHLITCPLYHSTAVGFASLSFVLGSTVVLLDRFEPHAFLETVARHRVNHTAMVPTMLRRVLELGPEALAAHDTSSLRAIFSGGAPLPPSLCPRVLDAFNDTLFNFYGATETGLVTLAKPADLRAQPATIGRCIGGNEIRLLRKDGEACAVDEVGELWVRSGNLVDGYHNNAEATSAASRDGFFSVGDLARCNADGLYFIEGRRRDMIISGGVNVYPPEVEAALMSHPDVVEAAVVGVADEEWGERVHAFVVPADPQLTAEELMQHARARLAGPKLPRGLSFIDALPRNPTGKVLKRQLRDQLATPG